MKKIFIAILLTFVVLPALTQAEDNRWVFMAENDDEASYYFDSQTIAPARDILGKIVKEVYTVYIRTNHTEASARRFIETLNYEETKEKFKSLSYAIGQYRFDIHKRQLALMSSVFYAADGRVLDSYSPKEYMVEYIAILPETIGELWFESTKEYYLKKYNVKE